MAIKKSQIYGSLWQSCDQLRGGMDASQYKDYVLVLLFVKYVSDKYAGRPDAVIEVPPGGSFADMVLLKGSKEIGDGLNKIIAKLAEANDLKGVIDIADFNDSDKLGKGKDMQDRLSNLVAIFENPALNFSKNRADGDDILGDAYEYLMRHFATESGRSKGQFYTPAEVSRVMAQILEIDPAGSPSRTIYDPTCGSGSLLLKVAEEANGKITIYGQERDNATYALAVMNMILHHHPTADIRHDNTLTQPYFKENKGNDELKTFDFAVSNPPFSDKAWSNGLDPAHDLYGRFADGQPPAKNGDYAFLLHLLRSLKSTGRGAIILPHGVLFRGNAEATIRRNLVEKGYIRGIIGLPPNLFFGTGIPACIIVIDKANASHRSGIFMIDASRGFIKDGNKNRLRDQDIHKIVDVFTRLREVPGYSRSVGLADIRANDYNLNIPRYIDSSEAEDVQDIGAHLLGGIPDRDIDLLDSYWQVFPALKSVLFEANLRPGYSQLKVDAEEVKPTIFNHPQFTAYIATVTALFDEWKATNRPVMCEIGPNTLPKEFIKALSEDILQVFGRAGLVNRYDVYQHLMSYWSATMQDDLYMLVADGWQANPELIPPTLLRHRYFEAEVQNIERLQAAQENLKSRLEELDEEHGGEGGLLEEAKGDKNKLNKAALKVRLKDIVGQPDSDDERNVLIQYLNGLDAKDEAARQVLEAQKKLDAAIQARYQSLSREEVQSLVIDDKWLAALETGVQSELNRVSQALAGRVKELAERYAEPLPQLSAQVEALHARVQSQLQRMGYIWN